MKKSMFTGEQMSKFLQPDAQQECSHRPVQTAADFESGRRLELPLLRG